MSVPVPPPAGQSANPFSAASFRFPGSIRAESAHLDESGKRCR